MIGIDFDWSIPMNQLILLMVTGLLLMQVSLLRSVGSDERKTVRLVLNVLLWCGVMGLVLKPYMLKKSAWRTGFIAGKDVPRSMIVEMADSLKTAETLSLDDLESNEYDTLLLAGQDFDQSIFSLLRRMERQPAAVKWIPYDMTDQTHTLRWKGILRKGEMQTVKGHIRSSKKQVLKLKFGNQTLDSATLSVGQNVFRLSFPAFSQGRTSTELVLADKTLDSVRFFVRPPEKRTFHFILGYPDFETRTLANWLGKNGHAVQYNTMLSKNTSSKTDINKAGEPDVVVTDPANAGHGLVKKAMAAGKSILFINLTDPAREVQDINRELGTRFQISRSPNGNKVPAPSGLSVLPFRLTDSDYILKLKGHAVAVEKASGKVGISLINETFPLMLSGDSTAYQKTWGPILALMQTASVSNIDINAPVFQGITTTIGFNNFENLPSVVQVGKDSVFQKYSPFNKKSASARFLPSLPGWITLSAAAGEEETAIFVDHAATSGAKMKTEEMADFIRSYTSYQDMLKESESGERQPKGIKKNLPDWVWFALLLICFTALWAEPKLR
jgi:hypothetical protein